MTKELLLEISYLCNLNCIHCSSTNCHGKVTIKDLEKIEIINDFDVVRISGGEPTLNNNIIDYVLFFKNKNAKVILQTNGQNYLSENILKNIDEINLSLYGKRSVHNFITSNEDSFHNTMKFIRKYVGMKKITLCSPIFDFQNALYVCNIGRYYNLPVRFTSLLNHGKCNFAKPINQQISIYNKIKKVYNNIEYHCSLSPSIKCNINTKFVLTPDKIFCNCASTKQGQKLCKKYLE